MSEQLHDYQQRAITYLYEHGEAIGVMPMGAGKTVCVLTAIAELIKNGEIVHATVFAPLRVARMVWPVEAQKWPWLRHLRVVVVIGNAMERERLASTDADIHVFTYDNIQWFTLTCEWDTDLVVFDEITRLKNPKSVRAKQIQGWLKTLQLVTIWGLSGTIAPNGYQDLFKPAAVVTRNKLWGKSFYAWQFKHFEKEPFSDWSWQIRPGHDKIIEQEFATISFRVADDDMPDVPELVFNRIAVQLPAEAHTVYRDMQKDMLVQMARDPVIAANAGAKTMKLRQISQGFIYNSGAVYPIHMEKIDALIELVASMNGVPLLIAYDFRADLHRIQEALHCPYIGEGVGDRESQALVEQWNARKLPLLAVHPASAGHGLNMQDGGNHICWYGLVWSLEQYQQLIKRIHRQGQKARCFNHVIMSDVGIDQEQLAALQGKQTLQEAATNALRAI